MNSLIITLVVLSIPLMALLVAAETAFTHTTVTRIERLDGVAEDRRDRVLGILDQPDRLLNPLRLGIVLLRTAEVTAVAVLSVNQLGWPWLLVPVAVNAIIVFVGTEVGPRTLGVLHAEKVAVSSARAISSLVINPPVAALSRFLIWLTNVIVPGKGLQSGPFVSSEEFLALADAALEYDVIEKDERDLIESVIEFGDTILREVMVPRTDMTTVNREDQVDQALEVCSEAGLSRLPVKGESLDDIVGLVFMKDLIRAELDEQGEEPIHQHLREARFVPETKGVSDLLKEMQRESFHLAMVVDEYGGIAGLVTLEDLIEELVGEIVDEFDSEEPLLRRQKDGSFLVDGRLAIDELNDLASLELPEGDFDTVGGLVFDLFGRVPSEGEATSTGPYTLVVDKVHGRRITRVHIQTSVEAIS